MIDYLVAEHQLERTEAYMLCSVAGDLKLHEVVRTNPSILVRREMVAHAGVIG